MPSTTSPEPFAGSFLSASSSPSRRAASRKAWAKARSSAVSAVSEIASTTRDRGQSLPISASAIVRLARRLKTRSADISVSVVQGDFGGFRTPARIRPKALSGPPASSSRAKSGSRRTSALKCGELPKIADKAGLPLASFRAKSALALGAISSAASPRASNSRAAASGSNGSGHLAAAKPGYNTGMIRNRSRTGRVAVPGARGQGGR